MQKGQSTLSLCYCVHSWMVVHPQALECTAFSTLTWPKLIQQNLFPFLTLIKSCVFILVHSLLTTEATHISSPEGESSTLEQRNIFNLANHGNRYNPLVIVFSFSPILWNPGDFS